jgi:hypothetical protein
MDNQALISMLRRQAVATLQKSTKMFEQALSLRKEGKRIEAEKLRTVARLKRNDSIWLMRKANKFEREASNPTQYPGFREMSTPFQNRFETLTERARTTGEGTQIRSRH